MITKYIWVRRLYPESDRAVAAWRNEGCYPMVDRRLSSTRNDKEVRMVLSLSNPYIDAYPAG